MISWLSVSSSVPKIRKKNSTSALTYTYPYPRFNTQPAPLARDWVSPYPKANGYQALHLTLMSNKGQWIEVQIRSERMNDVAEQGFAAHWKYKEGGGK